MARTAIALTTAAIAGAIAGAAARKHRWRMHAAMQRLIARAECASPMQGAIQCTMQCCTEDGTQKHCINCK